MNTPFHVFAAATLLTITACSSTDEKSPTPPASTATAQPATDGGSGTPSAAPAAPTVTAVSKMMGALHIMWTNTEKSCDALELERQAQMAGGAVMEKYAVVFTFPGDADNKHDTTATAAMTYTYRLRCKKGGAYSAYSNEMAGNPKQ